MTCDETILENAVKRMLHTGETLGGIIVFVVDVDIAVVDSLTHLGREQIVVHKRLGGLAGKFHHHAGRRVGVHIGVLACDVVVFSLDNLKKHVASLGSTCDRTLVAIGDVTFGNFFAGRVHQLELYAVLYLLDSHLLTACHGYDVGYTCYERLVLAHLGCQHSLTNCSLDFFFIIADDTSVALNHCMYHLGFMLRGIIVMQSYAQTIYFPNKTARNYINNFPFWTTFHHNKIHILLITSILRDTFGQLFDFVKINHNPKRQTITL